LTLESDLFPDCFDQPLELGLVAKKHALDNLKLLLDSRSLSGIAGNL
jgi:hypothetical protein